MQWHNFIFSIEQKYKASRHLTFWALWWLYFFAWFSLVQQPLAGNMKPFHLTPGPHLAIKTSLLVFLYAIASYPIIYRIMPLMFKGRWLIAVANLILICLFLLTAAYLVNWVAFPFIDWLFGTPVRTSTEMRLWPAVSFGLLSFAKVAAAAASVKYVKYWWIKEKEGELLEKERIAAELGLLKAQVHPDFLIKTLNNIYSHALSSSGKTSEMLLKLSDLLSYMLYECDREEVPLDRELEMMKKYMQLEQLRQNIEPEIHFSVRGNLTKKKIAPFLLLPFIENSFRHCGQMTEQSWINLDISLNEQHFSMRLTNGIYEDLFDEMSLTTASGLLNAQKRLSLTYPCRYDLRMVAEQEMFIVLLDICLTNENVKEPAEHEIETGYYMR